jgi:hypothetical protein
MNVHRNLARLLGLAGLILAGVLLFAAPAVATAAPAAGPGDIAVPVDPPPPEPEPNPAVEPGADDVGVEEPCWQTDTCKPPVDPCLEDPESCEPVDPCIEDPMSCEQVDPCEEDPSSCEPTTTTTTAEPQGVPVPTRIDTGEGPADPVAWWLVIVPGLALLALAAGGAYWWIARTERIGR